jgi:hypothetical protein
MSARVVVKRRQTGCGPTYQQMFAWAMNEGPIDQNLVTGTNTRSETPRDRALVDPETGSFEELIELWKALDDSILSDLMRLLILTGQV